LSTEVINSYTDKAVGLDPGFGSCNFGVCITEVRDGIVNVLHAEEYQRPDYNTMIQTTISLLDKYGMLMMFFSSSYSSSMAFPVRQIVLGQYIGIGLLIAISALGSLISLVVPPYITY
jgi:hypothetical protein